MKQVSLQLDLFGLPTNYHCHKCPYTASEMSDICRHSKVAHSKQYKKCKKKGCIEMIINSKLHKFCLTHKIEFEQQNPAIYSTQEPVPQKICQVCKEPMNSHTPEMAEECIDSFAEDMMESCIELEEQEQFVKRFSDEHGKCNV